MPPIKKMVVEWLNEVNYADDSLYIPSDFALEFVNFIKVLNGEDQEEHNTPVVHYRMLDQVAGPKENIINLCARGLAKSLPLTSKVFTQTGRCTIVDLQIGDFIAGADGIFTPVIAKSKIFHKIMYKIHLADGRYQVVSEDHINSVIHKRTVRYGKQSTAEYQKRNLTVKEILHYTLRTVRKVTAKNPTGFETNFWIPNTKAIKYNTKDFPLDPYTLGVILGDGSVCRETGYVRIHGHKDDFPHYHKSIPYAFGKQYTDKRNTNVLTQGILKVGSICKKLGINVHGDFKFIPEIYLYGSIEQRLALLQGLMDTDGTCYSNGGVAFCSNSYKLAKGVQDLVRSLGGIAKMGTTGKAFRVNIRCNFSVFKLIRKKEREHTRSVEKVGIHAITEMPIVPSQCIAVDNIDHTFLIDEYTVTHNTTLMCQYLILYIAVYGSIPGYGRIDYALYVADAIENNVKKMRLRLEMFCNNKAFLKTYLSEWKFTDVRWYFKNKEGKEFVVSGHGAKALTLHTQLFTETGYTTIKDCYIGQKIYAPDGHKYAIIGKSEIFNKPTYAIVLDDGRELHVTADHINSVVQVDRTKRKIQHHRLDITTTELLQQDLYNIRLRKKCTRYERNFYIENINYIEYAEKKLPVEPYLLGLLLGDGSLKKDGSTVLHAEATDMLFYLTQIKYNKLGSHYLRKGNPYISQTFLELHKLTKPLGIHVHGDYKFVPKIYMFGSVDQRLTLLQGLLDTDGTISKTSRMSFSSNSYYLCYDVASLIRSLGGEARLRLSGLYKGKKQYKVEIKSDFNPFRLPRKAEKFKKRIRTTGLVGIVSIRPLGVQPSQCITIDSLDHQFIAGDYIRTHNSGVRGTVELGTRPQLALLDDLLSDDDAKSPTIIKSIENTVYKAIEYALHPQKRKTIWCGTPFNAKDPLYKAVESGAWYVNVYPICNEFPCKKENYLGAWPDRFDYVYVLKAYTKALKNGELASFNQELMLRIMSEEDRLIQDNDINWYRLADISTRKAAFNFYITTDFATSEATASDNSVILVWAVNSKGWWFLVDGICKRQLMDKNIDDLFRLAQKWKPQQVGIEVSGQQGGFIPWIQREMTQKNIWFTLASENNNGKQGIRPVTNKMVRFNLVVPWFKSGQMHFPTELKEITLMAELINELSLASPSAFRSKHDDCIDAISMLSSLTIWLPSEDVTMVQSEGSDMWEIDGDEAEDTLGINSYIV